MRITIIGAGISGLSLAYLILHYSKDIDLMIFERAGRAGGKIWTEKSEGYLCEASVNGFLNNKPETLDLAKSLSLDLLKSNDNARRRFILSNNKLQLIPDNPKAFFLSNFLSLSGRLRILREYFIPKGKDEDESLESFALRRVGKEFYEKLLDPMASGIYAGDPSKMSIKSCFGRVFEIEKKYGSLIKGFIAIGKEAKKTGKKISAGPSGVLHSFPEGMYSLIESLKISLSNKIITNKELKAVQKITDSYELFFHDGTKYQTDILIFAIPAHDASESIVSFDKKISEILKTIPYPPVSVVALGIDREKIKTNTDAFGFLIPAKEKRKILGTLFDSSIFSNRAPEGKVLMRCFVGGARNPDMALLDDELLIDTVLSELKGIIKMHGEPHLIKIFRWQKAIPQYLVGHSEKLSMLDSELKKHKGLYLTGNAYRGVSVNDCIANSFILAKKITSKINI